MSLGPPVLYKAKREGWGPMATSAEPQAALCVLTQFQWGRESRPATSLGESVLFQPQPPHHGSPGPVCGPQETL